MPLSRPVGAKGEPAGRVAGGGSAEAAPRRLRRLAAGVGVVGVAMLVVAIVLLQEPSFYREVGAGRDPQVLEAMARRMVTTASALHAAAGRRGSWDGVIRADEANAWLATDLPRNHHGLLPRGVDAPRVAFLSNRMHLGARLGLGPLSTVAWVDIEPRLVGVNQVGLTIHAAGLGRLPLPRDALLHRVAHRLAGAGWVTDLRRHEGRPMLVVSPPAPYDSVDMSWRLESLAVERGELLVAGTTGRVAKGVDRE